MRGEQLVSTSLPQPGSLSSSSPVLPRAVPFKRSPGNTALPAGLSQLCSKHCPPQHCIHPAGSGPCIAAIPKCSEKSICQLGREGLWGRQLSQLSSTGVRVAVLEEKLTCLYVSGGS